MVMRGNALLEAFMCYGRIWVHGGVAVRVPSFYVGRRTCEWVGWECLNILTDIL